MASLSTVIETERVVIIIIRIIYRSLVNAGAGDQWIPLSSLTSRMRNCHVIRRRDCLVCPAQQTVSWPGYDVPVSAAALHLVSVPFGVGSLLQVWGR